MSIALLLIDPQNDFCHEDGVLYVPGAVDDCIRTSDFILKHTQNIDSLYVTLDKHPAYHIAHPCYWLDKNGHNPKPYTQISLEDFQAGLYSPADSARREETFNYLQTLQAKGRYTLIIWPPHCLDGSTGAAIEKRIWSALCQWQSAKKTQNLTIVHKSSNPHTEQYSALQAEVPDTNDKTTMVNFDLINKLKEEDTIYIAGEALSHCLANTIRDLSAYIPLSKIILLRDCASIIPGFETVAENFLSEMTARGMQCLNSTEFSV